MPAHSEHYWVGYLSQTIAVAATVPDPQPVLKSAIRDFLRDNQDTELSAMLRRTLKEKP
jgi:hypothetical protein